jgi:hypothetical protein
MPLASFYLMGPLTERLTELIDGAPPFLFGYGASGDVNCLPMFGRECDSRNLGHRLAELAADAFASIHTQSPTRVLSRSAMIELPLDEPPSIQTLEREIEEVEDFISSLDRNPQLVWVLGFNCGDRWPIEKKRNSAQPLADWARHLRPKWVADSDEIEDSKTLRPIDGESCPAAFTVTTIVTPVGRKTTAIPQPDCGGESEGKHIEFFQPHLAIGWRRAVLHGIVEEAFVTHSPRFVREGNQGRYDSLMSVAPIVEDQKAIMPDGNRRQRLSLNTSRAERAPGSSIVGRHSKRVGAIPNVA